MTDKPTSAGERMILVSERKVEVLKVFYALFTTLMDTAESEPQDKLIHDLQILRQRLRGAVSDAEMN